MADVPHFDLPFRFPPFGGNAVEVEQDSQRDVANNVVTWLLYRPGQREELPDYGMSDPTFLEGGINLDDMTDALAKWEPRAIVQYEEGWDLVSLIQQVLEIDVQLDTGDVT